MNARFVLLLAVALAQPALAASPLGRLFYTPEQRQALVAARARGGADVVEATTAALPAAPRRLTLTGIVERRGQPSVAWIDGQAVEDGARLHGYRVHVGARGIRLVPRSGLVLSLAVGQTLDLDTGTVHAPLAADAVSVGEAR